MTIDASRETTAPPIVRILNEEVRHDHRWCTASTLRHPPTRGCARTPTRSRRRAWVGAPLPHVAGCDKVKTTVALSGYALRRFAVSEALVERGIVVEKAGVTTITFITRPADHAPVPRAPLREVDTRASG